MERTISLLTVSDLCSTDDISGKQGERKRNTAECGLSMKATTFWTLMWAISVMIKAGNSQVGN